MIGVITFKKDGGTISNYLYFINTFFKIPPALAVKQKK